MAANQQPLIRVTFSDGHTQEWILPEHDTVENTFEQIRQTIVHSHWFQLPGTAKSYSPHAIVSIEAVQRTAAADDEASGAEKLGQQVREHVIDPISES
jgi:hypothetical protein